MITRTSDLNLEYFSPSSPEPIPQPIRTDHVLKDFVKLCTRQVYTDTGFGYPLTGTSSLVGLLLSLALN